MRAIIEETPEAAPARRGRAIPEPQDPRDAPLEGVVLDAVAIRKAARDEMFRHRPMRAAINSC
jgi:hypothetical protein